MNGQADNQLDFLLQTKRAYSIFMIECNELVLKFLI